MRFFPAAAVLAAVLFSACGNGDPSLRVKQFHLRDISRGPNQDPFVRGEQQRRLFGAVSIAEREQRLGQYYTVFWNNAQAGERVRILFEYRQAASGRDVLTFQHLASAEETSGQAEFSVVGSDYLERGRVLAWQATLFRGDRIVGQRRSYLWR